MEKTRNKAGRNLILLFILTIIAAGFLYYNYSSGSKLPDKSVSKNIGMPNFEIDQILIKILLKQNEYLTRSIRITNTGKNESYFELSKNGVEDLVRIEEPNFLIKPGQSRIIPLNFSTKLNEGIEYEPGVYVGRIEAASKGTVKIIPVIIEIESKDVLFDTNLNLLARERNILQGEEATIEVKLYNLQSLTAANVEMEYEVIDLEGNIIITESETVVVKNQVSFFKTIKIPFNLKPGNYVFVAKAKYGSSIGTASYLFEVSSKEEDIKGFNIKEITSYCGNDPFCWSTLIAWAIIILLFGIYIYFTIGDVVLYWAENLIKLIRSLKPRKVPEGKKREVRKEDKEDLRSKLIQFKETLWQLDQHLKYERLKEAFESYSKLKECYKNLIYSYLSKKGKKVLYHRISEAYRRLNKHRK